MQQPETLGGAGEPPRRPGRYASGSNCVLPQGNYCLFRCGEYSEALTTLTTSNGLHSGKEPADLAFLAMTQERLGMRNAARTTLQKLKVILGDNRAHDFLRE